MIYASVVWICMAVMPIVVQGCTNIIVSPGASSDSSSIISYNADSATLYGSLYHYAAGKHEPGTKRDIYDWDSGKYLGQIEEALETYNVVGNVNEFGLIIGESTYGGLEELQYQEGAIMDYGSLIWVTLQRAKTAREAIHTLGDLMATYGYASGGESFSIADQNEAWIMEIIGKGNFEKGSVWVALKIPDGYVTGHANQARITTFPLDDPENSIYAPDVISFARKIGIYSGEDKDFSFSDVYDAVTFHGARFCDARVWSFFSTIMGQEWQQQYLDYALGYNLTNRMPLWVKPSAPISVKDTMQFMRNHYDGTDLDMSGNLFSDVGAGSGYLPNRVRPLTWLSDDAEYFNERAIATPQTGWNFVAQSRKWMPDALAAVIWFGVDDSSTTVHFPVYGSATRVAESFAGKGAQDGVTTNILHFSFQNAFSVFNLVANWAYSRWNVIYPDVIARVLELEQGYFTDLNTIDKQALALYNEKGRDDAVAFVTEYSVNTGNALVKAWGDFFGQLFMKYRDFYTITPSTTNQACGCSVQDTPYSAQWYSRIVSDTGNHYKVPAESSGQLQHNKHKTVSKISLLSKR